jgi:hypothetical protein
VLPGLRIALLGSTKALPGFIRAAISLTRLLLGLTIALPDLKEALLCFMVAIESLSPDSESSVRVTVSLIDAVLGLSRSTVSLVHLNERSRTERERGYHAMLGFKLAPVRLEPVSVSFPDVTLRSARVLPGSTLALVRLTVARESSARVSESLEGELPGFDVVKRCSTSAFDSPGIAFDSPGIDRVKLRSTCVKLTISREKVRVACMRLGDTIC